MDLNHPATQEQDSITLNDKLMLRSQLTASHFSDNLGLQVAQRTFTLGYAYRRDRDLTHLPNFHQLEWLIKDANGLDQFLYLIKLFLSTYFSTNVEVFVRPSFFPFTYCSFEIDIELHGERYEVAGAGFMHGQVLKRMGLGEREFVPALAFGIERLIMVKYGLKDISMCYQELS